MTAEDFRAQIEANLFGVVNVTRAALPVRAGDPKRAAQIIVGIVSLDDPPIRLLLGAGAVESAARSSGARAAEAERWSAVSRSAECGARAR